MSGHLTDLLRGAAGTVAVAWALAACGDGPGEPTPDTGSTTSGFEVTDAIRGAALPGGLAPESTYMFVSASPGTVPGAARAALIVGGAHAASAVVRDGGFDPLPIAALAPGPVVVQVTDSAGRTHGHEAAAKGPARPRVVRTSPAPGRTDVPLNTRVTTVFSVPMEVTSVAEGVELWHGGTRVAGTVRVSPDAITADFVPDAPLEADTDYELRIAGMVQDVLQRPMEQSVSVAFRTGSGLTSTPGMTIRGHVYPWLSQLVEPSVLLAGEAVDVFVEADGVGPLASSAVRWSSSDPTVLSVEQRAPGFAIERGIGPGRVVLRAEWDGGAAEIEVDVVGGPAAELRTTPVYVARYDELWRQRAGGADAVRLMSAAELPADSTLCIGTFTSRCYQFPHAFAVAPDGRIAVTRLSDVGGVWVKDPRLGTLRRLTALTDRGAAHSPAWSPTGDRLAYWFDFYPLAMTELRVVDVVSGAQRVLRRVPYNTNPYASGDPTWTSRPVGGAPFVWHADGRRLLMATDEGTEQLPTDVTASSTYLPGHHPGPWFPGGGMQMVIEMPYGDGVPMRVFRASAAGVVDPASAMTMNARPIAISPNGAIVMDRGYLFTMDRTESFEVTGYQIEHLVGFAP